MIIPESVRKCVVFIGYKMANETFSFAGSGFFLGKESTDQDNRAYSFLVTAKHVIDGIRRKGLNEIYVRVNNTQGDATWEQCNSADWKFHPTDKTADIALLPVSVAKGLDHLIISRTLCITDQIMTEQSIGLGDEVFIVGLFRHHHGTRKNIPIVRIGNLAAMNEEKVTTEAGEMDAYLIEARSIGGLSGSPVFVNLGNQRFINGRLRSATGHISYLCGLIHGHYDVKSTQIDDHASDESDAITVDKVNTGIAIVVPIHKVTEAIDAHLQKQP